MSEATVAAAPDPTLANAAPAEAGANDGTAPIASSAQLRGEKWQSLQRDALQFMGDLETLRDRDRGALAALRRNAGATLENARGVAWIHGRLQGVRRAYDEKYFLVATLFDWNRKRPSSGDFGTTMRMLADKAGAEAVERRFLVLLDAAFDPLFDAQDGFKTGGGELAFRLRQMVKLAASKEIGINWPILLADLCFWDAPDKRVQKKWARNFYAPGLRDENTLTAPKGD